MLQKQMILNLAACTKKQKELLAFLIKLSLQVSSFKAEQPYTQIVRKSLSNFVSS